MKLVALLLIGCGSGDPPRCSDAGASDPSAAGCCQISVEVNRRIQEGRGCSADGDCTWLATSCGLPYACGAPVNKSLDLTPWIDRWRANCPCGGGSCPVIPVGRKYVCVSGQCGAIDP